MNGVVRQVEYVGRSFNENSILISRLRNWEVGIKTGGQAGIQKINKLTHFMKKLHSNRSVIRIDLTHTGDRHYCHLIFMYV